MINYTLDMYRQMFVNLKRGNNRGVYSNAKPIFLISILDYIIFMNENKLIWEDKKFEELYFSNFSKLESSKPTPLCKPFYFMCSENFYTIVWREKPKVEALISPSNKTLRVFSSYAQLDDELWELLQFPENRAYLRDCIIKTYFTKQ